MYIYVCMYIRETKFTSRTQRLTKEKVACCGDGRGRCLANVQGVTSL